MAKSRQKKPLSDASLKAWKKRCKPFGEEEGQREQGLDDRQKAGQTNKNPLGKFNIKKEVKNQGG